MDEFVEPKILDTQRVTCYGPSDVIHVAQTHVHVHVHVHVYVHTCTRMCTCSSGVVLVIGIGIPFIEWLPMNVTSVVYLLLEGAPIDLSRVVVGGGLESRDCMSDLLHLTQDNAVR